MRMDPVENANSWFSDHTEDGRERMSGDHNDLESQDVLMMKSTLVFIHVCVSGNNPLKVSNASCIIMIQRKVTMSTLDKRNSDTQLT